MLILARQIRNLQPLQTSLARATRTLFAAYTTAGNTSCVSAPLPQRLASRLGVHEPGSAPQVQLQKRVSPKLSAYSAIPTQMALQNENIRPQVSRAACLPCRTSKRRCDRALPSCGLCIRREAICHYQTRRHHMRTAHAETHPSTLLKNGANLEVGDKSPSRRSGNAQHIAHAVYFLAPQLLRQAQLELPRPSLYSQKVADVIGDTQSIGRIASSFFGTIHPWLPIVSKHVFYTRLLNPLADRSLELSLVSIAMKLCCTAPMDEEGENAVKNGLYKTVKTYYQEIESAGHLSIHVLQAGILIALYELGHAIYPAAYLTVGACARYGQALGLNKLAVASTGDDRTAYSLNDIEDRRRVWWAVLIFDRFLSLGDPSRSLSTDDPLFTSYLPVDDGVWDDGKLTDTATISTGFTLKMGIFARLAQATFLHSQARELINSETDASVRLDKMAQLRRTSLALVHTADAEATARKMEFCAQSGLSLSTVLLLQEHHLCSDADQMVAKSFSSLWQETHTTLDRLSATAIAHLSHNPPKPQTSDPIPIFMIHVMYQATSLLLMLKSDAANLEIQSDIDAFKSVLQLINLRWRLAGVYLNILESKEIAIWPTTPKFIEHGMS